MNKHTWKDTYPKERFDRCITDKEIAEQTCFSSARVKVLMHVKNNIIHDKKAEICMLREKNESLVEVIRMMVRGINNMSSPRYGSFQE